MAAVMSHSGIITIDGLRESVRDITFHQTRESFDEDHHAVPSRTRATVRTADGVELSIDDLLAQGHRVSVEYPDGSRYDFVPPPTPLEEITFAVTWEFDPAALEEGMAQATQRVTAFARQAENTRRRGHYAGLHGKRRDWSQPDAWHRGYLRGLLARLKRIGFHNYRG